MFKQNLLSQTTELHISTCPANTENKICCIDFCWINNNNPKLYNNINIAYINFGKNFMFSVREIKF